MEATPRRTRWWTRIRATAPRRPTVAWSRSTPVADAERPDGPVGPPAEELDQAALQAVAAGVEDVLVPFAVVTYVRPTIGDDAAAFWLQAEQLGPGVFVAVDPASLEPPPSVGDRVSLRVTEVTDGAVTGVADWAVMGHGGVNHLVQHLTLTERTWADREDYIHELVRVAGVVTTPFGRSGAGFEAAWFGTFGVRLGANVRVRMPTELRAAAGVRRGCLLGVGPTPLWSRGNVIYYSAWTADDLTVGSCGAGSLVVRAEGPTEVSVTLSRDWDAESVVDYSAQFRVPELAVLGGSVEGRVVTLQTEPQSGGRLYALQMDEGLRDISGEPLRDDERGREFRGFEQTAWVVINEVSATLTEDEERACDLVEMRALSAGSLDGVSLRSRGSRLGGAHVIKEFADRHVEPGDLLVVHMDRDCNDSVDGDGEPLPAVDEVDDPAELARADYPRNHDGARDFWSGGEGGLSADDNVLYLRDAEGVVLDAVPLVGERVCDGFDATWESEERLAFVAAQQQWERAAEDGGGVSEGGFVGAQFCAHAVADSDDTAADVGGASIQRIGDGDTNSRVDWTDADASTWGAPNAGQGLVPRSVLRVHASGPREVVAHLSRGWDPESLADPPARFAVAGLGVLDGRVEGRLVTLETEPQNSGQRYELTVSDAALDADGDPLPAAERVKVFTGFDGRARLQINEINANIRDGEGHNCDLLELRVLRGGSLGGMRIREKGGLTAATLVSFPDMLVEAGELLVVHLDAGDCNPSGAMDEVADPTAQPRADHPRNFDSAYDLWVAADGIREDENVLYVQAPGIVPGEWVTQDGVLLVGETACEGYATGNPVQRRAAYLAELGEWQRREADGGGVPEGGFVDEQFCRGAIADLDGTGQEPEGTSLQRIRELDTQSADDWDDSLESTWGALNPGQ